MQKVYEGYAQQRINEEDGMFADRGYIAYKGYFSLEEVMDGSQGSSMEMGGWYDNSRNAEF